MRYFLTYEVVCCHKDRDSKEYARTYDEALNQTLLIQKDKGPSPNTFNNLEAYRTY